MGVPREVQLVKAARMRAALNSYFNTHGAEQFTVRQLMEAHEVLVTELEYKEHNMYTVLQGMITAKHVSSERAGTVNYYGKYKPKLEQWTGPANGEVKAVVKEKVKEHTKSLFPVPVQQSMQEIKIDVVKSTGRVRLSVGGVIVIDIGVVDN